MWPIGIGYQEQISNQPAVLLLNGGGIERTGSKVLPGAGSGEYIGAERK
jgi:hypothetical protein